MPDDVKAACERLSRNEYRHDAPGHSQRRHDLEIVAAEYLSLGERQPDRFAALPFINITADSIETVKKWRHCDGRVVRVATFVRETEDTDHA